MLGAANDNVSTLALYSKLPITVHQSFSRTSQIILIAILVPLLVSLATPFALVADTLIHDPEARAVLAGRPGAAAALIVAILMLGLMFCWPLYRLALLATEDRTIKIAPGSVSVHSRSVFGSKTWSMPISGYQGIAKGVRSSLSGVAHELLLVHPDRRYTVVMASAPHPLHEEAQALARILGLAEISTRTATSLPIPKVLSGLLAQPHDAAIARI